MKITHVISSLGNGGAERLVVDLSNEMAKTEDVTIISFKDIEDWMFPPKDLSPSVKLITLGKKKGLDVGFILSYYKLILFSNYDIINLHLASVLKFSYPLILTQRSKFVHTLHNLFQKEFSNKWIRKLNCYLYEKKILFPITISDEVHSSLLEYFSVMDKNKIYNGVKPRGKSSEFIDVIQYVESLKSDENSKIFLSIGRISHQKNYELLINVIKMLNYNGFFCKLLIIGNDIESPQNSLNYLKSISNENIIFLGAKSNIFDYLQCCNVLCFSSLFEGMPITMIEAFSVGLPVVCTPAGGLIDFVKDYENGFISDDFTEESLYMQFVKFFALNQEQIQKIKENNLKVYQEKFDIKLTSRKYLEVYQSQIKSN